MIRNGIAIFITILTSISPGLCSEANDGFPSYPEVWGYDLWEIHKTTHRDGLPGGMEVLYMENGDYLITFRTEYCQEKKKDGTCSKIGSEYGKFPFFLNRGRPIVQTIEESAIDNPFTNNRISMKRATLRGLNEKLVFKDGGWIENHYGGSPKGGYGTFINKLVKKDKMGKEITIRYLLYLRDKPIRIEVNKCAEMAPAGGYVNETVYNGYVLFVPLRDQTFLAYDMDGTFVIRLNESFQTKSQLLNKKLFLLDENDYGYIHEQLPKDWDYQSRNDAAENYLLSLRNRANKGK